MTQSQETPEVPEEQVAGAQDPATGPAAAGSGPAGGAGAGAAAGSAADAGAAGAASASGGAEQARAGASEQAGSGKPVAAGESAEPGKPVAASKPAESGSAAQQPSSDAPSTSQGSPASEGSPAADGPSSAGKPSAQNSAASSESPSSDEEPSDPLSEAMNTISSLEDQLARRAADLYNLEQQYSNYVRRSKGEAQTRKDEGVASVIEALLPVLDDAELAREHGDLTGPVGTIVEKFEQTLRTSFGVERYGAVGDEFDPLIHEALMHSASADVASEQIGTLIQPGYRIGEKVLRPARVGVVSPE